MRKKIFMLILILSLCVVGLVACQDDVKDLNLTGDIIKTNIKTLVDNKLIAKKSFTDDGKSFKGYSLTDIFNSTQQLNFSNSVFIEAKDGTVAEVRLQDSAEVYLIYQNEEGYCIKSPSHPPMTDINNINKLVLVSDLPIVEQTFNGVYVFNETGNKVVTTAGNMYKDSLAYINASTFTYNGTTVTAKKYTKGTDTPIKINDKFSSESKYVKVFGKDGGQTVLNNKQKTSDFGFLEYKENEINFFNANKSVVINNIVGVLIDDFYQSNAIVFDKAKANLDNGDKVIIIEFDGFSLQQFNSYKNEFNFLKNYTPLKVTSVYPSISNVGLASILTGKTPKENNVLARSDKTPSVQSIFGYAKQLNANRVKQIDMAYFEGDKKMLNIEVEAVLHTDYNNNGRNDDDTFLTTKNNLDKDLIYVHFHSSDDEGSLTGPFSNATKQVYNTLDSYVAEIANSFNGIIYVVSDHGMHDTAIDSAGKGYHSTTTFNDMIIPFFEIDNRR